MIISALLQFVILLTAMLASAVIGYWYARQREARFSQEQINKMAKTIEQLRERATQAEADKVRALIASDRDRKRAEAWRPTSQVHPNQ